MYQNVQSFIKSYTCFECRHIEIFLHLVFSANLRSDNELLLVSH